MEDTITGLVALFIPIAICVILPVMIVWLVCRMRTNADNKRAEIIIEAIKCNDSDPERLSQSLLPKTKTPRELLNLRLLRGCVFTLLGVVLGIICLILGYGDAPWFQLNGMVVLSGVFLAIGVGYLIVYFVTKKDLSSDPE